MYGLQNAGRIEMFYLTKKLAPHGYRQCIYTASIRNHKYQLVISLMVVDDVGVKYIRKQNKDHFIELIRKYYPVNVDWTGGLYCGIKLYWNYDKKRIIELSMKKYLPNSLH